MNKEALEELGAFFKKLRSRHDVTQKDVADVCEYETTQFVSNVERGLAMPSPVLIKAYADLSGEAKIALVRRVVKVMEKDLLERVAEA